ncbi:MAG: hypothetical protein RRY33_08790, partial [Alistipes sp.]
SKLVSPWNNKTLNICFIATATLHDKGLSFSGKLLNDSDFIVEYVSWPYLGEVALPDKENKFYLDTKNYTKSLYPRFPSEQGYWGVDYPTTLASLPADSYFMLRNDHQGLVVSGTKAVREFVIGSFELAPGFEIAACNPCEDRMDGQDVRIIFKANRVLYAPKGSSINLDPLTLTFYKGSWCKGLDEVRNAAKSGNNWSGNLLTWRRVGATEPRQLIAQGRDAVACGVEVLLVSDWYKSSDDQLVEVKANYNEAIAECQKMGLKVVLESDFLRTDFRSEQYAQTLKNLIVTDPYGYYYNKLIMCPLCEQTQALIADSYDKTFTTLKADGVSCIDVPFRIKTIFCHNSQHGHHAPQFTMPATVQMDANFTTRAKHTNANIQVGGTYLFDSQNSYFDFMVLPQLERREALRYLNPQLPIVACIDVRTARSDINECIKNQYLLCYGPLFKTSTLASYPNVVKYVNCVEQFRKEYGDYLWNSEMTDCANAHVTGTNSYAVYQSKNTGKKAVVLVNDDSNNAISVSLSLKGVETDKLMAVSPELHQVPFAGGCLDLPALSVVVVIEK